MPENLAFIYIFYGLIPKFSKHHTTLLYFFAFINISKLIFDFERVSLSKHSKTVLKELIPEIHSFVYDFCGFSQKIWILRDGSAADFVYKILRIFKRLMLCFPIDSNHLQSMFSAICLESVIDYTIRVDDLYKIVIQLVICVRSKNMVNYIYILYLYIVCIFF